MTWGMLMMGLTHSEMRRPSILYLVESRLFNGATALIQRGTGESSMAVMDFSHPKDDESNEHNEYHTTSDREHSVHCGRPMHPCFP